MKYTDPKEFLGKQVHVAIERKFGERHSEHGWVYPVNYGFIPNTWEPDNEELDAYVLGVNEPLNSFDGVCIAYIHRTNDNDPKLIVVPEGMQVSDDEIRTATHFQEQYFKSDIIR